MTVKVEASPHGHFTAFILCALFGMLGIHRFYVGKTVSGVVWLLTMGLFGLGALVDLVLLTFGGMRDAKGRYLIGGGRKIAATYVLVLGLPLLAAFSLPFIMASRSTTAEPAVTEASSNPQE